MGTKGGLIAQVAISARQPKGKGIVNFKQLKVC